MAGGVHGCYGSVVLERGVSVSQHEKLRALKPAMVGLHAEAGRIKERLFF